MAFGNVPGIGHIQIVEGIVFHESNIFHPLKGPIVVNCSNIIFHLSDMLIIEHYLKRAKKSGTMHILSPFRAWTGVSCGNAMASSKRSHTAFI